MNGEIIRIQNPKSTVNYRHGSYNIKEKIMNDRITNTNTYSHIKLEDNRICYIEFGVEEENKE